MELLAILFQFFILIVCFMGIGLLSRLIWPEVPFGFHFCFAPLGAIALLFCLEHFFPLGQQPWIWIPWSLFSLVLIKRFGPDFYKEPVLWYFLIGFGICFFWRFSFPDVNNNSEMMADMDHLISYSSGSKLPAEDTWMKGANDDMYYIFQYYAAGLIHRFMGSGPGMTYHLAYCTLIGVGIAAVGVGVQSATGAFGAGVLACLTLALGGIGTTYLTPFMAHGFNPAPVEGMRFIGCYGTTCVPEYKTDFGVWICSIIGRSLVDAPMEYYSYIIMIGDYHPSLSSLAFFGLLILAIGMAEKAVPGSLTDRFCVTGAIATAVFVLISNTWIMPLNAMAVVTWLVYRKLSGRRDSLTHILGSTLACVILIFPFFNQFAQQSGYYPIHIEWVEVRPPFLNWIMIMFPAFLIWLLTFWEARKPMFARFATIVGLGASLGTYFFYVHDIYGGSEAIFNTSLKWWPWSYALVIMLGIIAVWSYRIPRYIVTFILVSSILFNSYIFARFWLFGQKSTQHHRGKMNGYAWFQEDSVNRDIYLEMQNLPKGVLLESDVSNTYDVGCSLSLFTGHYSLGGYTGHESLWRGYRSDLEQIRLKREVFFKGLLDDPLSWLRGVVPGGVDYITWLRRDNDQGLEIWPKLNEQLKAEYDWRCTFEDREARFGIWIKRKR